MPNAGRTSNFAGAAPAVLVMRGDRRRVIAWVERGTVPSYVFDLPGSWCAVVPAGGGHARVPYAEPAIMTAVRPTPMSLRPSMAFLVERNRAVCVVQARRWRALPRWFVVEQGVGPVRAELPQASRQDLFAAAPQAHPEAFERVISQVHADPVDMLRGIMGALDLPGGDLLDVAHRHDLEADVIEPVRASVRRFDKNVAEERVEREEVAEMTEGEK